MGHLFTGQGVWRIGLRRDDERATGGVNPPLVCGVRPLDHRGSSAGPPFRFRGPLLEKLRGDDQPEGLGGAVAISGEGQGVWEDWRVRTLRHIETQSSRLYLGNRRLMGLTWTISV